MRASYTWGLVAALSSSQCISIPIQLYPPQVLVLLHIRLSLYLLRSLSETLKPSFFAPPLRSSRLH